MQVTEPVHLHLLSWQDNGYGGGFFNNYRASKFHARFQQTAVEAGGLVHPLGIEIDAPRAFVRAQKV